MRWRVRLKFDTDFLLFFSPFLPGPLAGAMAVGGGASLIVDVAVRVDAEASFAMPMCPGGR